jgi:hypothetical protein
MQICRRGLERFRAKWIPVRVKKTRQNKKLEPGSDSIRTEKALEMNIPFTKNIATHQHVEMQDIARVTGAIWT